MMHVNGTTACQKGSLGAEIPRQSPHCKLYKLCTLQELNMTFLTKVKYLQVNKISARDGPFPHPKSHP